MLNPNRAMKSGAKSTEFWGGLVGSGGVLGLGIQSESAPASVRVACVCGVTVICVAYIGFRSLAKSIDPEKLAQGVANVTVAELAKWITAQRKPKGP